MKSLAFSFLLILAAGAGYWAIFRDDPSADQAVSVTCLEVRPGPFVVSLKAGGRLISRKTEEVKSAYAGVIQNLGIENGAFVSHGARIAVIVPPEEIRTQKQIELELAGLDLALLEEQRKKTEEMLALGGVAGREMSELVIRHRKQQALVENLREELRPKPVLAPFSGLLVEKRFQNNGRLEAGAALFTLIDTRQVAVAASIHQFDLPKIHLGQNATVRSEIFLRPHKGTISEIPSVTVRQNAPGQGESYSSFFNVVIQLDQLAPDELRIGAAVEVEIVLEEKTDVISVPLECVHFEGLAVDVSPRILPANPFEPGGSTRVRWQPSNNKGRNGQPEIRHVVFINENGVARQREITIGAVNENAVEVLSGLREGELVIVSGNAEIVEGRRL